MASRKPKSLADVLSEHPPLSPKELFETVPGVMQTRGRVEGFEALRDLLLANWRDLAAGYNIPLHALLKLVLETDRHALFAMLSEEKLGDADRAKQGRYKWFQQYLEGEVDSPLPPEEKLAELPANEVSDSSSFSNEGEESGRD